MSLVKVVSITNTDWFYSKAQLRRLGTAFLTVSKGSLWITAYRSNDDGDTWSSYEHSSPPRSSNNDDFFWDYDSTRNNIGLIYTTVSYASGMTNVRAHRFVIFDLDTNSWTNDVLIKEGDSTSFFLGGVQYSPTDDRWYAIHRGLDASVMGNSYATYYLGYASAAPGSTWTTDIDIGLNESEKHTRLGFCHLDPRDTDLLHVQWDLSQTGTTAYGSSHAVTYHISTTNLGPEVVRSSVWGLGKTIMVDQTTHTRILHSITNDDTYTVEIVDTDSVTGEWDTTHTTITVDAVTDILFTEYSQFDVINPDDGSHQMIHAGGSVGQSGAYFHQTYGTPGNKLSYESNLPWEGPYGDGVEGLATSVYEAAAAVAWDDAGTRKISLVGEIWPNNSNTYFGYFELTPAPSAPAGPQTVATAIDAILFKTNVNTSIDAVLLGSGSVWVPIADVTASGWTSAPLYAKIDEGDPFSDSDWIESSYDTGGNHFSLVCVLDMPTDFPAALNNFRTGIRFTYRARDGGSVASYTNMNVGFYNNTTAAVIMVAHNSIPDFTTTFETRTENPTARIALDAAISNGDDIDFCFYPDGSLFDNLRMDLSGLYLEALRFDDTPSAGLTGTWGHFGPVYVNGAWYCIVHDTNVQWLMERTSPVDGESLTAWTAVGPPAADFVYGNSQPFYAGLHKWGSDLLVHWGEELRTATTTYVYPSGSSGQGIYNTTTGDVNFVGNLWQTNALNRDELNTPSDLQPSNKLKGSASNGTYNFRAENLWASDDAMQSGYRISDINNTNVGSGQIGNRVRVVSSAVEHLTNSIFHVVTTAGWGASGAPNIETVSGSTRTSNVNVTADAWLAGSLGVNHGGKVIMPAARISGGVRCASFTSGTTPTITEQTVSTRNAYKAAYEYRQTVVAVSEGARVWVFWIDATNDAIWAAYQNDGESTWTEYGEVLAGGSSYTFLGASAGLSGQIGLVVSDNVGPPTFHLFQAVASVKTDLDAILQLVDDRSTDLDAVLSAPPAASTISHNYDFILSQRLTISHDYDMRLISRSTLDHTYDFILYQEIELSPTINMQLSNTATTSSETTEPALTNKGEVSSGDARKKVYLPDQRIVRR